MKKNKKGVMNDVKKATKMVKEDCPSPIVPLVILLSCKQAEDQLSFLALGMAGG